MINEEIERLRHASTQALLTRKDVIIVASVSCIYGLGDPEEYEKVNLKLSNGDKISRGDLVRNLIDIHYKRTNADVKPGVFRALGNAVEIMPISERVIYRVEFKGERVEKIQKIDAVSRTIISEPEVFFLFPAKHFITADDANKRALESIKSELEDRVEEEHAHRARLPAAFGPRQPAFEVRRVLRARGAGHIYERHAGQV